MYKINVIGIGPGQKENMTFEAVKAIQESDVIAGYKTYIELIRDMLQDKEVVENGMTREVDRCKAAIKLSMENKIVSVVSSGDPGVYGMAGLILEILSKEHNIEEFEVNIIPGVTAANAGGAILGAPLMHDYVTISLSDCLTSWATIENRLHCAGKGDFCVVIYNPKSKSRQKYIGMAQDILMNYKDKDTVVGIVKNAYREDEIHQLTTLEKLKESDIDMFTTVFIGNSMTYQKGGYMITPRGYEL